MGGQQCGAAGVTRECAGWGGGGGGQQGEEGVGVKGGGDRRGSRG